MLALFIHPAHYALSFICPLYYNYYDHSTPFYMPTILCPVYIHAYCTMPSVYTVTIMHCVRGVIGTVAMLHLHTMPNIILFRAHTLECTPLLLSILNAIFLCCVLCALFIHPAHSHYTMPTLIHSISLLYYTMSSIHP